MISVSKIMSQAVDYGIKKPINAFTKTRFADNVCKNYQSNNVKYIAGLGIASVVLKDAYGCYLYVKQSLNNKKIPEDKRKFVAALDLTNGGLMILMQLLMFFTMSNPKVQGKIFNKLFGKIFSTTAKTGYEKIIRSQNKFKNISAKEFDTIFENTKKDIETFFGIFTSLAASTIIAKRVIVPFIATPLADKAEKFMTKDDDKCKDKFTRGVKK
ncbi:MAG: hypothetical protein WCY19_03975 [Candidatus Gastranaerophilaceae bacterium]